MIKRLRHKFFINAMIAFVVALFALIVIFNVFITIRFNSAIDVNLDRMMRMETDGIDPPDGDIFRGFNERVFIVKYSDEEGIIETEISFMNLITEEQAQAYAIDAIVKGDERGWKDNYRYLIETVDGVDIVIFIDGDFFSYAMTSFRNISLISLGVTVVLVSIFVYFASKKAIEPIEASQERQKQFMTDASHELKTPLTVIHANAEIAKLNDPHNEWLEGITKQTHILTNLIHQIIRMSKLDEADIKIDMETLDLSEVIDDVLEDFLVLIKQKNIEINKSIKKPAMVKAHQDSIKELMRILIDNAVKYVDEFGDINIKIDQQKKMHIYIMNQYNDIANLDTTKMFDRFYRADEARQSNGSFGLGLSIAKSIVEIHHGHIKAYASNDQYLTIEIII